jgi:hypothetical protein
MLRIVVPGVFLGLAALSPRAEAGGVCPFDVQFTGYGSACSTSGAGSSTLSGYFMNVATGCSVTLTVSPAADTPSTYFISSFLFLDFQSVSAPLPNGCTLLAFPTIFFALPFTNALPIPLPPDPALAGASVFSQGVVYRTDILGTTNFFDLTAGTQISIL